MAKMPNQNHDNETFIVNSGAMSRMVNSDENIINLKDAKIGVTIGYSRNINGTKRGIWHGFQRHAIKLHGMTVSNTALISGLQENLLSVTLSIKKIFQVTSEGETLILNKNSTNIRFDKKMANIGSERFILTTRFYKNANSDSLWYLRGGSRKRRRPREKKPQRTSDVENSWKRSPRKARPYQRWQDVRDHKVPTLQC